jgi:hypothetical protein
MQQKIGPESNFARRGASLLYNFVSQGHELIWAFPRRKYEAIYEIVISHPSLLSTTCLPALVNFQPLDQQKKNNWTCIYQPHFCVKSLNLSRHTDNNRKSPDLEIGASGLAFFIYAMKIFKTLFLLSICIFQACKATEPFVTNI